MDIATIIGIVVSFGLMIWAILMGGPLSLFIDTPSIAIVFGGTAGVALISFPLADVLGTIHYELLCSVKNRVPRYYI